MTSPVPLHAFAGYGLELEYMLVDRESLRVLPLADRLLDQAGADEAGEVRRGAMGWSNELVKHVVEIKNVAPQQGLGSLCAAFREEIAEINRILAGHGARLMPGGMHPWMDPARETQLWDAHNAPLYAAFDRIFDCRRHGWANLQSMHLNLPFHDDGEFERLHAAIRLVLPILPALAASSPIAADVPTGFLDFRLEAYRANSARIPSITGAVIPETVFTRADYEARILEPMYRDIAPFDSDGLLCHEWLNSRGAIARFDRSAIEIRVIDVQECPRADLSIAAAACRVVQRLYDGDPVPLRRQQGVPTEILLDVFDACIRDGELAQIESGSYLEVMAFPGTRCEARELWEHLVDFSTIEIGGPSDVDSPLRVISREGTLARRIVRAVGKDASREALAVVYGKLCECLSEDRLFRG